MRAGYELVRGGCLMREPPEQGSDAWWDWFREGCRKENPYPRKSREWALWRKRLQTNPFRRNSYSWHRWNEECCVRPSDERYWLCCPTWRRRIGDGHDATECLEREPENKELKKLKMEFDARQSLQKAIPQTYINNMEELLLGCGTSAPPPGRMKQGQHQQRGRPLWG